MMRNITLGKKITGGFVAVLILLAAVSITGLKGLDHVMIQMTNAQDAARLIMLMGEARRQEKNFILRKDHDHARILAKTVAEVSETAQKIRMHSDDPGTISRILAMEETIEKYSRAFDSYVSLENQVREADALMVTSARQLEKTANMILTAAKQDYQNRMQAGMGDAYVREGIQNLEDSETIIQWVLQCRRYEKNYLIRGDLTYYDRVTTHVEKIIQKAGDMKNRFKTALEKEKAEQLIKVAKTYLASLTGMEVHAEAVSREAGIYRHKITGLKVLKESQKEVDKELVAFGRTTLELLSRAMDYEKEKMDRQASGVRQFIKWVTAGAWILGLGIALVITRGITRPLNRIIRDIAGGDLTSRLDVRGRDEVGQLAGGFNTLTQTFQGILKKLTADSATMDALSGELVSISSGLDREAGQTAAMTRTLAEAAGDMTDGVAGIACATEQSSSNAAMVASAAEGMTQTVSRIARDTDQARQISRKAVEKTRQSVEKISFLGQATQSINQVTETITNISDQINLLALNATIEAARAGAAGRGFAVVANEIKLLAGETSAATLDITDRIQEIQNIIGQAVGDIDQTASVISQVDEIVVSIARAIGEQSSGTREIAESIVQVSQGTEAVSKHASRNASLTESIAEDIKQVDALADSTTAGSQKLKACSDQLRQMVDHLEEYLGAFRI